MTLNEQLLRGAKYNDPDQLSFAIAHGADLNTSAPDHKTALMIAAKNGCAITVRMLIEAGALPQIMDLCSHDALYYAQRSGNHESILLIQRAMPRIEVVPFRFNPESYISPPPTPRPIDAPSIKAEREAAKNKAIGR